MEFDGQIRSRSLSSLITIQYYWWIATRGLLLRVAMCVPMYVSLRASLSLRSCFLSSFFVEIIINLWANFSMFLLHNNNQSINSKIWTVICDGLQEQPTATHKNQTNLFSFVFLSKMQYLLSNLLIYVWVFFQIRFQVIGQYLMREASSKIQSVRPSFCQSVTFYTNL